MTAGKANNVAKLEKEKDEINTVEHYKRLKKELKDEQEKLVLLLHGDRQRTKNILRHNQSYQRMFYKKQSYEVLDDMEYQAFLKRKQFDLNMDGLKALMGQYERDLVSEPFGQHDETSHHFTTHLLQMEVAVKQEMIRYYDIKEFKQERDTKRIFVELKNTETRSRAVRKVSAMYKKVIDQLLRDSIYYEPVLGALKADWDEQTMLVNQTFNIGFPAIQNVKKLKKELMKLHKTSRQEETTRFADITKYRQVLKENPKKVKEIVRRDVRNFCGTQKF
jgi:hypothetical protein